MKKILYLSFLFACLTGCNYFQQQRQTGVIASIGQNILTLSDLDDMTRHAESPEDSARIAEQYIRQWAIGILEYAEANDYTNPETEALVEDYRRALYIHEYEQRLVSRHMPTDIHDTIIRNYYESHKQQFILRENILQGILLVYPVASPNTQKLKQWLTNPEEKNLEQIEKYAYQYATGYELFIDEWKTANQLLLRMPLQPGELEKELKKHAQIEVSDSVSTYLLQVTDKHMIGDNMPIEYATDDIRKIILSHRQVEFLQDERNKLYEESLRFNRLKIYEQTY